MLVYAELGLKQGFVHTGQAPCQQSRIPSILYRLFFHRWTRRLMLSLGCKQRCSKYESTGFLLYTVIPLCEVQVVLKNTGSKSLTTQ